MSKHRKRPLRNRVKRAAVMGGVSATATALTMGLTAPAAGASAMPDAGSPRTDAVALTALSPTDILNLGSVVNLGDLLGLDFDAVNGIPDLLEPLGINVVTTGPPFGLAALFGLNLGYVPALPGLIVDEVTGTEAGLNIGQLLGLVNPQLPGLLELIEILAPQLGIALPEIPLGNGVRIPVVVGFGLGALAAGLAYPQIRDYFASEEQRDILTILPLLLLRNWGRADGGIAARFAPVLDPFARLFGYDSVVTPDVENDADFVTIPPIPALGFPGLSIPTGGLIPVKIDATAEYDPFSDFPAWPNPVSLANSVAAGLFPTYLLRGGDVAALAPQLAAALPQIVGGLLDENGAVNIFLTIPSDRQPILEPFRYPADVANFFTGGIFGFTNPFADAVEPAIKILGNLGYTNVVQNPTAAQLAAGIEPYDRDFSDNYGQQYAPFFTFPDNVDWAQVPGDVVEALVDGVRDAFFFGGIPGVNNPPDGIYRNPIDVLGDLASLIQNLPPLPIGVPNGPTTTITADKEVTPAPANQSRLDEGSQQVTMEVGGGAPEIEPGTGEVGKKNSVQRNRSGKQPALIKNLREARENVRDAVEDGVDRLNDAGGHLRNTLIGGSKKQPARDTTPSEPPANTNTQDDGKKGQPASETD